jgi:aryl-alcohol dehydrogenase-like predicted oxidoreductase
VTGPHTAVPRHTDVATLGPSGVPVTRLGLGTAAIGGLFTPVGDEQAAGTLDAAWASGTRYFDTAPHYGTGLAERRLGAFLRDRPRGEVTVSTKVGRLLVPGDGSADPDGFRGDPSLVRRRDYTAEGVYRSVADSLERTGLDLFDVLLIHDPDEYWTEAVSGAYPALDRLRAEGAVGAIGAGMNQTAMLSRFVRETDVDCVLVAGRYSLLDRSAADDLLRMCQDRGVGVLVGGVFNSGVLADPHPRATFDYAPVTGPVLERAQRLRDLCAAHRVPLTAAALQFALRHPAVTGIVVGARTADEVTTNNRLLQLPIPSALWADLEAEAAAW